MSKEPSKRGGARPGSGPKPKHGVKQVPCSFSAPPAVIAALDSRCKALGVSRGGFIAADPRLSESQNTNH